MTHIRDLFLLLLVLAFPGAVWAAKSNTLRSDMMHNELQASRMSPEEEGVWRIIEQWNVAFAANDADEYFKFIDDDITVLTPSNPYRVEGAPDDREEFEFGLREGYSRIGVFQEIAPIVRVYGDTAFVTYFNRGYYGPEGGGQMAYLKETTILRRVGDSWKIIHIHVSK